MYKERNSKDNMIVLTNIYNDRKFTIHDDKFEYLKKFLMMDHTEKCLEFLSICKFINQVDCTFFANTIYDIIRYNNIHDFNVNGIITPMFNPTLLDLENPAYDHSPIKPGNSHFLLCLHTFLENSKMITILRT